MSREQRIGYPVLTGKRLERMRKQCTAQNVAITRHPKPVPASVSRPVLRSLRFATMFKNLKERFGCGVYSWSEGMTRRAARRIARRMWKQVA